MVSRLLRELWYVPETMPICTKCLRNKKSISFAKRPNGKATSYCRPCQRIYGHTYYSKNLKSENDRRYRNQKRIRGETQQFVQSLKASPCSDCGESHPYWAMDFDHRDPKEKKFSIGVATTVGVSRKRLLQEIEKCDLVCALCHRYRTYGQKRGIVQPGRTSGSGPLSLGSNPSSSIVV